MAKVRPLAANDSDKSRTALIDVRVGDILIMVSQERITMVGQWAGDGPDDAMLQKVNRACGRRQNPDDPVAAFAFVEGRKRNRYRLRGKLFLIICTNINLVT